MSLLKSITSTVTKSVNLVSTVADGMNTTVGSATTALADQAKRMELASRVSLKETEERALTRLMQREGAMEEYARELAIERAIKRQEQDRAIAMHGLDAAKIDEEAQRLRQLVATHKENEEKKKKK